MALDLETQIINNLKFFLDVYFLNNGLYFNVGSGQLDFAGNDQSRLYRVTNDPDYTEGRPYQSQYLNWVYEADAVAPSGSPTPTIASGVFVNGAFKTRSDALYGHEIDYPNGRVIFDDPSAVLSTDIVQAAFAVKRFQIEEGNRHVFPRLYDLIISNPTIDSPLSLPSGVSLPAVFIQRAGSSSRGLQLGGGKITTRDVNFHIVARDEHAIKQASFLLTELEEGQLRMIDWAVAPMPLTETGDLSTSYIPFTQMQASGQFHFNGIYFREMEGRQFPTDLPVEIEIVRGNLEIWRRDA